MIPAALDSEEARNVNFFVPWRLVDILPSVGTQICNFGDPETPFGDPGERFWSSRGAPGQPRGPLRVPGGSILGPWGTILAMQGSTGTAQRTPVGPDVDFDGFWIDF